MTREQLKKVVDFYEKVICQQIIKPVEIQEIYKLVKPEGMDVPYFQKMRAISIYVQGLQQQVIDDLENMFEEFDEEQETITNDPRLSTYIPEDTAASPNTPDDTQSHSEDEKASAYLSESDSQQLEEKFNYSDEDINVNSEINNYNEQIAKLEAEYKDAETNVKRSITMRINAIKKRMNE